MKIVHRALATRLPEHEAVKQMLRSAERLRAIGVALHHANRHWITGHDSWAKHETDTVDIGGTVPNRTRARI